MGEILSIASWVGTPLGGVVAVAFVTAMFFYGRWGLSPPKKAGESFTRLMGQSSIGQWAAPVFAFYNEKSAISEPPEVARSLTELSLGPLGQPVRHCIWVAVGLRS